MNSKKVFKLSLEVKGIAAKQRKVKNHSIPVAELPDNNTPILDAQLQGYYDLPLLKTYRSIERVSLLARPVTLKSERGFDSEEFMIFDPRVQRWDLQRVTLADGIAANTWVERKS